LLLLLLSGLFVGVVRAGEGGSAGDPIDFEGYARGELGGTAPPADVAGACRFAAKECWFSFWYAGGDTPYALTMEFAWAGERQDLDAGFDVYDDRVVRIGGGVKVDGRRGVRLWRHGGSRDRQRFLVRVYDQDTEALRFELYTEGARATPTATPTPAATATAGAGGVFSLAPPSAFRTPAAFAEVPAHASRAGVSPTDGDAGVTIPAPSGGTPVPPGAHGAAPADETPDPLSRVLGPTGGTPEVTETRDAPGAAGPVGREPVQFVNYLSRAGDTLSGVAQRFDVTVGDLMQANGLVDTRDVPPGTLLRIPAFAPAWQGGGQLGRLPAGPVPAPGDFILPVRGPIATPFGGETPFNPEHIGVDIAVAEGTPVLAMRAGVVTAARWADWQDSRASYGLYVEIAHVGGFATLYGHLSALAVRAGDVVEQGEVIGLSGNTGLTTGPHLHLMLRRGTLQLDPLAYAGVGRPARPPRDLPALRLAWALDDTLFYGWEQAKTRFSE
jgi:LysM repeat protein